MSRFCRSRARLFAITFTLGVGSVAPFGCQPAGSPKAVPLAPSPATDFGEFWDVLLIQGSRVGYTRTTVEPAEEAGRKLIKIVSESKLTITRYGEKNEQSFNITSLELPTGELVRFTTRTAFGPTPVDTAGEVNSAGATLNLVTTTGGKQTTATLPWPADGRGFFGTEQSLRERPMVTGEHRTIQMLVPIINQVAKVKLIARGKELTKLLDGETHSLVRIDCLTSLPDGNEIISTMWTNDDGELLKTRTDAMQQETYRTSKQVATAETPSAKFDLGIDSMIRIDPPLANPHDTKQVRYLVEMEGGDPLKVLAKCPSQVVRSTGDHTAEITVSAIRPSVPPQTPKDVVAPVEADRTPNPLVQSDDPRIITLAEKAAPASADQWQTALALEKWVHDAVKEKNFSQAFATAAEVAQSREGDCTEHAVLLAALLRARAIPARVAIGLVCVEPSQSFGYHMWTEAFIGDRWIPLDATLAKGGIGGGHLKLLDTNLDGSSAYSSFLPVAQVLGRLKVKVLEAK